MSATGGISQISSRFGVMFALGVIAFAIMLVLVSVWFAEGAESNALVRAARSYSVAINSFRDFYATNIVAPLKESDSDIDITHDYHDRLGAIPLPATLTMDLVEYMNQGSSELEVAMVSDMPFPWRSERRLTAFQQEALEVLRTQPVTEYYRMATTESGRYLQYAMPIRLVDSCVECHNTHEETPKSDWQVGDIRGIQMVRIPASNYGLLENKRLSILVFLIAISFAVAIVLILWMSRRNAAAFAKVEEASQALAERQFALDQHAIVSIADAKGNIAYANEKFCEISGYSAAELVGQNHRILRSGEHSRIFYEDIWRTITAGRTWHGEIKNRTKDGRFYWVNSTIVPLQQKNRDATRYISIRTDITERKFIEERLHEERKFLKGLTDAIGDGVYALDAEGRCTFLNPEGERMLGWFSGELIGEILHDRIHYMMPDGEAISCEECPIMQTVHKGLVYRSENDYFIRNGNEPFPVSVVSVPMLEDNRIVGSVSIFKDITEQKRRETELQQAMKQAEQASHAKSEFLSRMSHELRTPMNAILGFSQLLEVEALNDDQQEYVDEILKAGRHLLELINEVLDLSRIEAGRLELSLEPVSCDELLDECIGLMIPLAENRGISLENRAADSQAVVRADRTRLKQVLVNLISNAVKYNSPDGSVTVDIERPEPNRIRIRVSDTGPGIEINRQDELFEPFARLDAEFSGEEGTGIGLVISRRLAEMMSGTLDFYSEPGKGSCFWVELQCAAAQAAQMGVELPAPDHGLTEEIPDNGLDPERVLYIEDNPANLKLVDKLLRQHGNIQVLSAHTPNLGLELARAYHPSLILLDINMPEMDGYEVLARLKQDPVTGDIPVVAVTANAMATDIRAGKRAGFDDYITKPIDISHFNDVVRRYTDSGQ